MKEKKIFEVDSSRKIKAEKQLKMRGRSRKDDNQQLLQNL